MGYDRPVVRLYLAGAGEHCVRQWWLLLDMDKDGKPELLRVEFGTDGPFLKVSGSPRSRWKPDRTGFSGHSSRRWIWIWTESGSSSSRCPPAGSGGDAFVTAAKWSPDGWRLFPLPRLSEQGVSGFAVETTAPDASHLRVRCPATGFEKTLELPQPYDGYREEHASEPSCFSIDGVLDCIVWTGGELRIRQMIWSEWHANGVAWLETVLTLGPDGWTVLEQDVTPYSAWSGETDQVSQEVRAP